MPAELSYQREPEDEMEPCDSDSRLLDHSVRPNHRVRQSSKHLCLCL